MIDTRMLNLDVKELQNSCSIMYEVIRNNFYGADEGEHQGGQSQMKTQLYERYNVFLYPFKGYHELFHSIKDVFHELSDSDEPHYMQAWLNVYNKGEFIDWHYHWKPEYCAWHGFYCVDVEAQPSYTTYRFPDQEELVQVDSKDDLLVIGPSDGDYHKSSEWTADRPRVNIAFDIIPAHILEGGGPLNHYIPV